MDVESWSTFEEEGETKSMFVFASSARRSEGVAAFEDARGREGAGAVVDGTKGFDATAGSGGAVRGRPGAAASKTSDGEEHCDAGFVGSKGLDDEDVLGWTTGRKGETDDYQNSGGVSISQAQRLNQ